MACLAHNSRYRSLFHAVVNELRQQNRIPVCKLRNMPRQCCTCNDVGQQTSNSVSIDRKNKLMKLKILTDQIDRDKTNDSKLLLSLYRFKKIRKKNRISHKYVLSSSTVDKPIRKLDHDSSDLEEKQSMHTRRCMLRRNRSSNSPKALKNGRFLYLPYKLANERKLDSLNEAAKKVQRSRFIGRDGYIASLEKEHSVYINMITLKTTKQIIKTLKNAKAGTGRVIIHNEEDLSEVEDGEWIFVRPRKCKGKGNKVDFDSIMDELTLRWDWFLKKLVKKDRE
ncbi:unnamed protein product [Rotaria sp. Silwood2]|nr:unnamed protein product [Rotaria sp. Silwood2]